MSEIDSSKSPFDPAPALVWGWEFPVDLFFAQTAAGVLFLSAFLAGRLPGPASAGLRRLRGAAPLLLAVALGALFLDLAHKTQAWRLYASFQPASPLSWGAWIVLAALPVSCLWALAGLTDEEAERVARLGDRLLVGRAVRAARGLALAHETRLRRLSMVFAVALGGYSGVLLASLSARALWSSGLVAQILLASGVATAAALALLFRLAAEERRWFERALLWALAVEAGLVLFHTAGLAYGSEAARQAGARLLTGSYAAAFWSLAVGAGLVVPALLQLARRRFDLEHTAAAPLLVLAGGFALRWILVFAGQA